MAITTNFPTNCGRKCLRRSGWKLSHSWGIVAGRFDSSFNTANRTKMTNQLYDSITARCIHIWITITAKDCHPSYHGRGLSPSDYCLLHSQLESDNRLHLQSDYYGRGLSPSDNGLLQSQLESDNRLHSQSDHRRGLSPSDNGLLQSQLEPDNRLRLQSDDYVWPSTIGIRPRLVTLGLLPKLKSDNRLHLQSDNDESQLWFKHRRAFSPPWHTSKTSETTALHYSCNRMVWNGFTDPTYLQNLEHTRVQMTT